MPILQIVIFELFIVFLMFLILQQERKNLLKVKSIKKFSQNLQKGEDIEEDGSRV